MARTRAARPRRAWRAAWAAAVALAVVAPAGCGVRPTGIISAGDKPVAKGQAAPITVYLLRGKRLTAVVRPGLPGHPYLGVTQLGGEINSAERRLGLHSEVPLWIGILVRPGGPPADLVVEVDRSQPTAKWTRAAWGQVACTAQAVPGVKRVILAGHLDSGGSSFRALTRDRFKDLLG